MEAQTALQNLLTTRFSEARLRNPAVSLRSFARKAGLSASALSEILSGKRRVSRVLAERILNKLCVDPEQSAALLGAFPAKARRGSPVPAGPLLKYAELGIEQFRAVSEWYHFAILSLAEIDGYRHDAAWIAGRLGIRKPDAAAALERLEKLGMLRWDAASGKPVHGASAYSTTDGLADLSIRKAHAQNLELAQKSLENDPVNERDFSAVTMAIDPDRLPEARRMIREFEDRLCAFLEGGAKKEVHKICVQLFPLTRKENEV